MKKLLFLILPMVMAMTPMTIQAQAEHDGIETSVSGIALSVSGVNVHVTGANGEEMGVFNLTGAKVATIRIDSADKTFALNLPKGCYLIKIGKIVRKIQIQ